MKTYLYKRVKKYWNYLTPFTRAFFLMDYLTERLISKISKFFKGNFKHIGGEIS